MSTSIGLTGRIARASARRPWLTIGAWLTILVAAAILAGSVGNYVNSIQKNLVTTEANEAEALDAQLRQTVDGQEVYSETVIITSDSHRFGEPPFDAAIASAAAAVQGVDGVTAVTAPVEGAPVAQNGASAMITFHTTADAGVVTAAVDAVAALEHEGVETFVYGRESSNLAFSELAAEELARSEVFGLIAALVILVVVFGALVAAGLPLLVAIVSIITATGTGAVVARVLDANGVPMSDSMTIFIAMLGLALGIDYSLLTVQRFREELAGGASVMDAITTTGATANRAVLFSGATVVVALGGLLVVPLNTFLGIGVGVMAVALASVAATLFLMPAVLRLVGHRVNKGRVPTAHPGMASARWRRLATRVVKRPAWAAAVGAGLLLLIASPVLGVTFANPGPDSLPEDFVAHRANDVYVEDFGWTDTQTVVSIEGAAAASAQVGELASAIEEDSAFEGTTVDWRGDVAFIDTHDLFDASEAQAVQAIERLRETLIPAALAGTGAEASVGGTRAYVMDEAALLTSAAPWAVAIILGVSFVLLLLMFRSVVLPLKAIVMNLLGTLATFGALVAVYQWGWGSVLGLPDLDGISPYMPVMIFALVFGLSMDYHVFLLSRVKEHYDAHGNTKAAVIEGVTRTGPLITGAALIMVAVFSGFAAASIPELSQWGFGLALGVLIDATIIRVLLVPAAMVWLDKANWYLPAWLEWLPRITHEPTGEPSAAPSVLEDDREPALA
ncbi:MMPL family transporter [Demequina sp. SO4-13]|uniref:MMPL family transporter n=1 Tax=Demequina sp. SO4-13 TaxID=3401027 RepID=UPI003AF723B1